MAQNEIRDRVYLSSVTLEQFIQQLQNYAQAFPQHVKCPVFLSADTDPATRSFYPNWIQLIDDGSPKTWLKITSESGGA